MPCLSVLQWVLCVVQIVLCCVVSWCHISWTAVQLYSQAAWMERCLYLNGSYAHWCYDNEDFDAERWIQDGANKEEATVVTFGNSAQCDVLFGAVHPDSNIAWCCFYLAINCVTFTDHRYCYLIVAAYGEFLVSLCSSIFYFRMMAIHNFEFLKSLNFIHCQGREVLLQYQ